MVVMVAGEVLLRKGGVPTVLKVVNSLIAPRLVCVMKGHRLDGNINRVD
jgi:hypothetical protein